MNRGASLTSRDKLVDGFDRVLDYLRISVTDRCNLRCRYCNPLSEVPHCSRTEILSLEEIDRLARIFVRAGVSKVRLTGGEPLIRRGVLSLIKGLLAIPGLDELHITTNGTVAGPVIEDLLALGVSGINLSLDTLDRARFIELTGFDQLPDVLSTFQSILGAGIPLKINTVVLRENFEEISSIAELAREYPVEVRFIEEMPFNGRSNGELSSISASRIIENLSMFFPDLQEAHPRHGTAQRLLVPGFSGHLAVIAGYSRTFCGHCNRIRVTPDGWLKSCLYGPKELNLKEMLRGKWVDEDILVELKRAVAQRTRDGNRAFALNGSGSLNSMSRIGG